MSKDSEIKQPHQENCDTKKQDSNDCHMIKSSQNCDGSDDSGSFEERTFTHQVVNQSVGHAAFSASKTQVQAYSVQRIFYKSQFVAHWSKTRLFTRLPSGDPVASALPLIVKLRRQKICLNFSKTLLDIVRCLRITENKLITNIDTLRKIELQNMVHVIKDITESLYELSNAFHTTIQNFQRAYKDLSSLDCFEQVLLTLRKSMTSESIKYSCKRVFKILVNLSSLVVDLKAIEKREEYICIASSISVCSIFQKKLADFSKSLCYYIFEKDLHANLLVDFTDATQKLNILSPHIAFNKSLELDVLFPFDICNYLRNVAKKRSILVCANLSVATLKCLKTYICLLYTSPSPRDS